MSTTETTWSGKRKATAVVAAVLAGTMLMGGAYAWTDYSQTVTNSFNGVSSNSVLLHDDSNGKNKDVYVENLGDSPVYVRVKVAEYFQIGNNSMLTHYHNDDAKGETDDTTTWAVHQWQMDEDAADTTTVDLECSGDAAMAHQYYTWTLGSAKSEQKYYLEGITESDSDGHGGMSKTNWENAVEKYKKDNTDNVINIGTITTHINATMKPTDPMWLADYNEALEKITACDKDDADTSCADCGYLHSIVTDARWLLDSDGWAYWSQPLQSHTATNLLIDSVDTADNRPYDNWTYSLDVQLQASTSNQLSFWYRDNEKNDAIRDVADPDNSVMTTTDDAKTFLNNILTSLGITVDTATAGAGDNTQQGADGSQTSQDSGQVI
jgi:hypothetical protein